MAFSFTLSQQDIAKLCTDCTVEPCDINDDPPLTSLKLVDEVVPHAQQFKVETWFCFYMDFNRLDPVHKKEDMGRAAPLQKHRDDSDMHGKI